MGGASKMTTYTINYNIAWEKKTFYYIISLFLCLVFNKGSLVSGILGVKQELSSQEDKVIHAYMGIDPTRPTAVVKITIGTIKLMRKLV